MKNNWIFEIKNLEEELLNIISDRDDLKLVYKILNENSGITAFIMLYEEFNKSSIKFVDRTITLLKRVYVLQNKYASAEKLRRILDVDIRTIYEWRRQGKLENSQLNIFE